MRRPPAAAVLTGGLALLSAGPAHAFDAAVGEIHVTQSIQTVAAPGQQPNAVPLIADRATSVRVKIPVTAGTGLLTGRVHVFVGDDRVTPVAGVPSLNTPFPTPVVPDFAIDDGVMLFELPAPTGIAPPGEALSSDDVRVRVEIQGFGDTNPANNAGEVSGLRVERRVAPEILWTPIRFPPAGPGGPSEARAARGMGDAAIQAALPIDDSCPSCVYRRGLGEIVYDFDPDGDGRIGVSYLPQINAVEYHRLIDELVARRAMLRFADGEGPTESTFLFGWVRDGVLGGHAGAASVNEGVGYAQDRAGGGQTAFQQAALHEFTHMLGEQHNFPQGRSLAPNVGFDSGGRLVNSPPDNGVTSRVKPSSTPDVMNALGGRWTDVTTYNGAREALPLGRSRTCPRRPVTTLSLVGSTVPDPREVGDVSFNAPGNIASRLVERVQIPAAYTEQVLLCSRNVSRNTAALLAHVVLRGGSANAGRAAGRAGATRTIRVPIDPRVMANDHAREHGGGQGSAKLQLGSFHLAVPTGGARVEEVRITDPRARRTFARLRRSARAPAIEITSPGPGAALGRRTTLAWNATDGDTPRARLQYRVAYSPDAGRTWLPVRARVAGTRRSLTFDARDLPPSARSAMLRVDVSDGLNSRSATVRGLANRVGAIRLEPRRR